MKLETSEEERTEAKRWYNKDAFSVRSARDLDTLLAEVERLRAERRPFSDGLAQKVIDEQVKTIDRLTAKLAAEPSALMTVPEEALLEMLRTGSSMVYVNHVPGEVWRKPPAPPLPAEVEEMRKPEPPYE